MIAKIDWNPADRTLRQFGWLCAIFFPLIAWIFSGHPGWGWLRRDEPLPPISDWKYVFTLGAIGLTIAGVGHFYPKFVKPVFLALSVVTFPIGLVMGELIMLLIFTLAFLPMGVIFKLIGRDSMERKFQSGESYWRPKAQPDNVRRYYQQY